MNRPILKKLNYRLILIVAITFVSLALNQAIAHDHVSILFRPPPEDEQPEETEGAASRQTNRCAADPQISQPTAAQDLKLTAIAPQGNYGLTTKERPNLWIYLPETSAKQAILSIRKEGKTIHWQQSVDLRSQAGITGIELAENAPALEIGSNYQWAVILVCSDRPNPNDPVVTSWIKRIEARDSQSSSSSELAKASTYAQQGIWYDTIDILISEKSSQNNWQDLWNKYLESASLNRFANRPVVENLLLPK